MINKQTVTLDTVLAVLLSYYLLDAELSELVIGAYM